MKIFGYDINFSKAQNKDVSKPEEADVFNRYVPLKQNIFRAKKDLSDYKYAVQAAENFLNPQRYALYQIYINIINDAHLQAVITQRKNLTLQKNFRVITKGEVNEEKSKLLDKKWFREYLDNALDSLFWGHSLIQFGSIIKDEFSSVELIPRQFVKPEYHIVVKYWADIQGLDYTQEPYKDWCLSIGKPKDLGILLKAAPLILWKQGALGAWAEYQEVFGSPVRIGKTDVRDDQTRQNMIDMMTNMAASTWGVFDKDDELEFVESAKSDAFKVFDEMINRTNQEISKLILGQTSTTDEKSYSGSANVHERILEMYAEADEQFINSVNNYDLVPMLITHGLLSEGDTIEAEEADELSVLDRSKIDIELVKTGKYILSPEYILENYGSEVELVEQPIDTGLQQMRNALDLYYK